MIGYLIARLPLFILFVNGYLLYRLLATTSLTELTVLRLTRLAGGRPRLIYLMLMVSAALLSFFIPNAITVLTMLPVMKTLARRLEEAGADKKRAVTTVTLIVIYGANIGGMGSIIGSPANLLLIGALDYFQVPGADGITFANWFLWSLPLVAVFLLCAWALTLLFLAPRTIRNLKVENPPPLTPPRKTALAMFLVFLAFWTALAVVGKLGYLPGALVSSLGLAFLTGFFWMACLRPGPQGQPILPISELAKGFPRRGIFFLAAVILILVVVRLTGLDDLAAHGLSTTALRLPTLAAFYCLALGTMLMTEIFSNSVVAVAFFAVAHLAATSLGISPLALMVAISAASTCAFMTPIATPVNALAYGEMRPVSLKAMLGVGLILNLTGALLISLWLPFAVPLIYGG